ncbi:MAG: hypothetical protein ACSNEK_07250 [Parachlamydiaceae bacterium]
MRSFLQFLCILLLGFVSIPCASDETQESLDFLSSYIAQMAEGSPMGEEQEEELDELWTQTQKDCPGNEVELAHYYFEQGLSEKQPTHFQTSLDWLELLTETKVTYPHFDHNALINKMMKKRMKPYLLPLHHPIKATLDSLFATRVTENYNTLASSGFHILSSQESSFIKVVFHPALPNYIFKVYLDDETRKKQNLPGWHWLCNRCEGAQRVKRFIKKNHIKHFVIPNKWLYLLPALPNPNSPAPQPVIVVEDNMHIVKLDATREAWKTKVTKEHLDELFAILSNNMGSSFLSGNIPYTKSGKFAFVDTEYPKRKITLKHVKSYLSPEMQAYWQQLIDKKKKKKRK